MRLHPFLAENWIEMLELLPMPPTTVATTTFVRGAPWSAANRLHRQRTEAFSWRHVLRHFLEDRPIPALPYPELRTWTEVRSGAISVFTSCSGNAPASPDMRPTPLALSRMLTDHHLHPYPHPTHHSHD